MTDHQFEVYDKIYIYSGISDYGQKMTYVELLDTLNNLQQEAIDCQCQVEKVLQKYVDLIMAKRDEEWFKTENDIYFGSEFFKGYGD